MRRYFFQTPFWMPWLASEFCWSIPTKEKILYLTFDDGPTPEVTPFVLDMLDDYNAKATFFCIGRQITNHQDIFQEIINKGHIIGNHTQNHLNGWKTKNQVYLRDVELFDEEYSTGLFRPPYGKITRSQRRLLDQKKVVMWSHLSGDFDPNLNLGRSRKVLLKARKGSVMVFHDSGKAFTNLKMLLPDVLDHFSRQGFVFKSLDKHAVN